MPKHTLTIERVDPNDPASELQFAHSDSDGGTQGDLSATDTLSVAPKDEVCWQCTTAPGTNFGNFAILFVGNPPFTGGVVYLGAAKGKKTSARVAKNLDVPGTPEHFKYAAVVDDDGTTKFIDPFMDIDDGGGGGLPL